MFKNININVYKHGNNSNRTQEHKLQDGRYCQIQTCIKDTLMFTLKLTGCTCSIKEKFYFLHHTPQLTYGATVYTSTVIRSGGSDWLLLLLLIVLQDNPCVLMRSSYLSGCSKTALIVAQGMSFGLHYPFIVQFLHVFCADPRLNYYYLTGQVYIPVRIHIPVGCNID